VAACAAVAQELSNITPNFTRENLNVFPEICTEFYQIFVSQNFDGNQFDLRQTY
jgi:hypothetical protein